MHLLTYSMVQSPSWEANWFAASQEIPRISPNPKVRYRTHKRPPPVSILDQPNPVHITTSHLLEIRPNIIHQSTPSSPRWSLSLRFPNQDPIHPPLLTHTRHMPSRSHSSRFYHPHNIGWAVLDVLYALISQIYFWNKNLLISDSSSVHHQEFLTVHTAMVCVIEVCWQLANRVRNLMLDRGIVRNL